MKLKFRRGRPPLKVMTRGDQKPKPLKPLKSAAALEAVETPVAQLAEDKIVAARAAPICPLCKQPFTLKDFMDNKKLVSLNRVLHTVHKKCPTNQV